MHLKGSESPEQVADIISASRTDLGNSTSLDDELPPFPEGVPNQSWSEEERERYESHIAELMQDEKEWRDDSNAMRSLMPKPRLVFTEEGMPSSGIVKQSSILAPTIVSVGSDGENESNDDSGNNDISEEAKELFSSLDDLDEYDDSSDFDGKDWEDAVDKVQENAYEAISSGDTKSAEIAAETLESRAGDFRAVDMEDHAERSEEAAEVIRRELEDNEPKPLPDLTSKPSAPEWADDVAKVADAEYRVDKKGAPAYLTAEYDKFEDTVAIAAQNVEASLNNDVDDLDDVKYLKNADYRFGRVEAKKVGKQYAATYYNAQGEKEELTKSRDASSLMKKAEKLLNKKNTMYSNKSHLPYKNVEKEFNVAAERVRKNKLRKAEIERQDKQEKEAVRYDINSPVKAEREKEQELRNKEASVSSETQNSIADKLRDGRTVDAVNKKLQGRGLSTSALEWSAGGNSKNITGQDRYTVSGADMWHNDDRSSPMTDKQVSYLSALEERSEKNGLDVSHLEKDKLVKASATQAIDRIKRANQDVERNREFNKPASSSDVSELKDKAEQKGVKDAFAYDGIVKGQVPALNAALDNYDRYQKNSITTGQYSDLPDEERLKLQSSANSVLDDLNEYVDRKASVRKPGPDTEVQS